MFVSDVRGAQEYSISFNKYLTWLGSLVLDWQWIFNKSSLCFCTKNHARRCLSDVGHSFKVVGHKHPQQGKFLLGFLVLSLQYIFYRSSSCSFIKNRAWMCFSDVRHGLEVVGTNEGAQSIRDAVIFCLRASIAYSAPRCRCACQRVYPLLLTSITTQVKLLLGSYHLAG